MQIDVCSDLHVDRWWSTTQIYSPTGPQNRKPNGDSLFVDWEWYRQQAGSNGEMLIIGGDISNTHDDVKRVVNDAAEVYKWVVFVDGNHEHHNMQSYTSNMLHLQDFQTESITFLQPTAPFVVRGNTAIIGVNGWYDWTCYEPEFRRRDAFLEWQQNMADAKSVLFDDGQPDRLAEQQSGLLCQTVAHLANSVEKIVVVTHTVPRADLCKMKGPEWNRITPSFVNESMESVLRTPGADKIKLWVYGHTHDRNDVMLNNIRYVNNSVGYPREQDVWRLMQIGV